MIHRNRLHDYPWVNSMFWKKNGPDGWKWPAAACLLIILGGCAVGPVTAAPLWNNRHVFIGVANDAGVKYDWDGARYGAGNNNTYYIKADGGGLNELHITNNHSVPYGQVTTTTDPSGTFYLSNTGGRGYDDDIILLLGVKGTIPDDFAVRIRSSGYNWTPAPPGVYTPAPPAVYNYIDGAVNETFTKADLVYGPQIWKPGPGILGCMTLPLFDGQDMGDTANTFRLMFIDLKVGNLYPAKFPGVSLSNDGAARVEYEFTNLTTFAAFNGYGWCSAANQDQGISWTNRLSETGASGYTVVGTGVAEPVPLPGYTAAPTDPDGDGLFEDLNGNGIADFDDLALFHLQKTWIAANEPVSCFDFETDGTITIADVARYFGEL